MDLVTKFVRQTVLPWLLVFGCPPSMVLLQKIIKEHHGSAFEFLEAASDIGIVKVILDIWTSIFFAVALLTSYGLVVLSVLWVAKTEAQQVFLGLVALIGTIAFISFQSEEIMPILNTYTHSKDPSVYFFLFCFSVFELVLLKFVPGAIFLGPVTPEGNQPEYKDNGTLCFIVTFIAYFAFSMPASPIYLFPASFIYDNFGEVISACNVISLTLCLFLNVKGRIAPTNSDVYYHNFIFSYYWGIELHPSLFGVNVKQFTNCRFGMMAWSFILLSYAAGQYNRFGYVSDLMLVSVSLQIIYIYKFFWWETGYFCSIDMTTDRAGFYICWGCITWLPCLYTSATLYLADRGTNAGAPMASALFIAGLLSIWFNYQADLQRKLVRETKGECLVWGAPPKLIHAKYVTGEGKERESILLVSGFWGVARHTHYLFEIMAAFFWSVPSQLACSCFNLVPFSYLIFLTILLVDRSFRDDKQCAIKYGQYWDQYKQLVPSKIIPGIF